MAEKSKCADKIKFQEQCKICSRGTAIITIKSNIATEQKLELATRICNRCGAKYILKNKMITVLSVNGLS